MKWVRTCAAFAALSCLVACGAEPPPQAQASSSPQAVPARPALASLDIERLRTLAAEALRSQRTYAPVGDNAVEYYLALRDKAPGEATVANALQELQPYVLIAAEQAMAGGELSEAQRLLDLLARVDAQAPALPRLRAGLDAAHAAQTQRLAELQAEDQRLAQQRAAALATAAKPVAPAPIAPAPAATAASAAPPPPVATAPAPAPVEPIAIAAPPPAPRRDEAAARPLPRLISDSAPRYPLSALNRRIEGSVQIAFVIQPDGSVTAVRLLSSTPPGVFDEAALAAVSRWRFEAGGQRVPTSRTLSFRLPKG